LSIVDSETLPINLFMIFGIAIARFELSLW
jgi:hypothetical protein